MGDGMTDFWKEYRKDQSLRRVTRIPIRTKTIMGLQNNGHHVEQKTEYHFRIDYLLDVWPTHNRFHNIKTGKRGGYKSNHLPKMVKQQMREAHDVMVRRYDNSTRSGGNSLDIREDKGRRRSSPMGDTKG